jgi:hypothetical protein
MKKIEETLIDPFVERILSFEAKRVNRQPKEIPFDSRTCHTILKRREKLYGLILDAIEDYKISNEEEITYEELSILLSCSKAF